MFAHSNNIARVKHDNLVSIFDCAYSLCHDKGKSNLDFGDNGKGEKSDEDIADAADIAQAKKFIDKLPEGYDARVAQGGTNFSGGQKQRMAIAQLFSYLFCHFRQYYLQKQLQLKFALLQ